MEEKEYNLTSETTFGWDVVDDKYYKYETTKEYSMSKPSIETYTLRFTDENGEKIYLGCKFKTSIDEKRIEWYNDEHSGVIELK